MHLLCLTHNIRVFFFFQAEDGIRDTSVTGVQTCALPIFRGMLEGLFSYDDAPRWPAVLLEFWSQALRHPEVSKRLSQAYGAWRRQLTEAFAAAVDAGTIQIEAADDAASIALAAHDGHAVQVAIGSPGARAMSAIELADSLLKPLKPAERSAR